MRMERAQFEMEKMIKELKNQNGSQLGPRMSPKKTDPREELFRKLQGKGGGGHYFDNDSKNVRGAMTNNELTNILKLLSLGQKKVNFKFQLYKKVSFDRHGWSVKFEDSSYHEDDYDSDYVPYGPGVDFWRNRFILRKKG